ncbi:adenylate/guanylate cyclase domain-containing protein [Shimia thalassica]|jgi:adenylate cyclase|uniref:adenylate/guanylate cyclase domain-containing protein n=1 Tax=Shimia thalassica TaxID=1715693 RepID=UPI001C092567|nr:adenylate/guanylate cyclase domain-containing protein [Shimia thalassica]MBU2944613.1 adenylate/guanylate cyclase domain-containing protein [Shimia thalassica]MDO6502041.1 adenylate/guanylate cyclase domain-containing protein [Shimia thalassica]
MRFPLTLKFFLFAALVAIVPLALVGENLVRIARDELKSAANEDLTGVAAQIRGEFDGFYEGRWLTPLSVIRSGVDNPELDVTQKVSLLTQGMEQLPGVVALQLSVQGADFPLMVTDQAFANRLAENGLDPMEVLRASGELVSNIESTGQYGRPLISQVDATGDWLATLALPMDSRIAGRQLTLVAKIDLAALRKSFESHPFRQRGEITIVDHAGRSALVDTPRVMTERSIVSSAMPLIVAGARADALESYVRPDGTVMLGAYAFPDWFPWAVVTELSEKNAYAVIYEMMRSILIVGAFGFAAASAAALIFSRGLTGPILKIGRVAEQIGRGEFSARVENVRARDEIGDLSKRINEMAGQLGERLELMKFVSNETMTAIQARDGESMSRGGERRAVTMLFSDIRGYTAFSETVSPEEVILVLNQYFEVQTEIVERHGGDIDKFVGDELMAMFTGEDKELRATRCAVEIAEALAAFMKSRQANAALAVGIGMASGEVVLGAMGARDRMDYTVLGSTVNLAARLCSKAEPGQVLLEEATRQAVGEDPAISIETLPPVALKGIAAPVPIYGAHLKS